MIIDNREKEFLINKIRCTLFKSPQNITRDTDFRNYYRKFHPFGRWINEKNKKKPIATILYLSQTCRKYIHPRLWWRNLIGLHIILHNYVLIHCNMISPAAAGRWWNKFDYLELEMKIFAIFELIQICIRKFKILNYKKYLRVCFFLLNYVYIRKHTHTHPYVYKLCTP